MVDWTHAGASILAAFLASLVEFVEALTIVLAVGIVRGWRPALLGSALGGALLVILVAALGPLLGRFPLSWLQAAIGILLLLFGTRWLRKAVLRAAGIVPLRDEIASYAKEAERLRGEGRAHPLWDTVGVVATFKAVVLEGMEVVFIVIAIGAAGRMLIAASLGAGAALLVVVILGAALHRPIARVPENSLKFAVGVLLSAFGVFWIGEGSGLAWPGGDLAILGLIAGFLATALLAVRLARAAAAAAADASTS
jgi:uncharacterized membrane protein